METIKAKVVNWKIVDTTYGPRLVLNTRIIVSGKNAAVWSKDLSNEFIKSRKVGSVVQLLGDGNNYSILETKDALPENNIDSLEENALFLPQNYTENQLTQIENLAKNRAKVLVSCIEAVKNEMDAKGFEFYENSVRSLGLSLFINVSRYLD